MDENKLKDIALRFLNAKTKAELREILPAITSKALLRAYWLKTNSVLKPDERALIETRVADAPELEKDVLPLSQVLADTLPSVDEFATLMLYWRKTDFGSDAERLVEARIKKILAKTKYVETAMSYWWETGDNSNPREFLNDKIAELLTETGNVEILMSCLQETAPGSKPRELIEARVAQIVADIPMDIAVPEWFIAMVKDGGPAFLEKALRKKTVELLRLL